MCSYVKKNTYDSLQHDTKHVLSILTVHSCLNRRYCCRPREWVKDIVGKWVKTCWRDSHAWNNMIDDVLQLCYDVRAGV